MLTQGVRVRALPNSGLRAAWENETGRVLYKCSPYWMVVFDRTIHGRADWKIRPHQLGLIAPLPIRKRIEYCLLNNIAVEFSDEV